MKRDIKLNISQLKGLSQKLADYIEAVRAVGQAAGTFQDTIREQDSDAYRKLDGLWETNVKENAEELANRLNTIHYYLSDYITEMTSFITPDKEEVMMRADRNDIWFNYQQISFAATGYMDDILPDTGSSWRDYHRNYYYDRRLSPEENDARRAAVEAEVEAERSRRERNYGKLAGFRSMLGGSATERLQGYVKELKQIYDENVVPFENTDDQYDASLGIRYNEWCILCQVFRENLTCSIGPIAGGNLCMDRCSRSGGPFPGYRQCNRRFLLRSGECGKRFYYGNRRTAGRTHRNNAICRIQ